MDLGVRWVVCFATGEGVTYMVDNRGAHAHRLEHRGIRRSVGVRTGGCDLLRPFEPFPELFQVLPTHRGFKPWKYDILLVGDVLAASLDEML